MYGNQQLKKMIVLENLDFNNDTNEVRADFGGFFEDGFYITCEVEFDEFVTLGDDSVGLREDAVIENFSFWYFKIFNSANEEISFSSKLLKDVKQDIETELTKRLEE